MKRKGTQFEQQSMFDASSYDAPAPTMNHDPEAWATRADITYHASNDPQMPGEVNPVPNLTPRGYGEPPRPQQKTNFGYGFHHGDLRSAMDRGGYSDSNASMIPSENYHSHTGRAFIHPLRQGGEMALLSEPNESAQIAATSRGRKRVSEEPKTSGQKLNAAEAAHPLVHEDAHANWDAGTKLVGEGKTVPYVNAAENPGSISFRSPRENISSWGEDVAADPGASRGHKLMAEQFDLTIPIKENWTEGRLRNKNGPNAKNLPTSLSGQVIEQQPLPGIEGDTQVSGQSELHVLRPKMKRKEQP